MAVFDYQKGYMYQVQSPTTVRFIEGYDHFSFHAETINNDLNDLVYEVLQGNVESDPIWAHYVAQ